MSKKRIITTMVLSFILGNIIYVEENPALREKLEDWKYAVLLSMAQERTGSTLAQEPQVFNPRLLGLKEAVEIAAVKNLGFQNTFGNLEITARRSRSLRASIFEPSLQFGWSKSSSYSPAQGPIPAFSSQADGGNLSYNQKLKDGTDIVLDYNTRNTFSTVRSKQNNSGLELSFSRALIGKSNNFASSKISLSKAELDEKVAFLRTLQSFQNLMFQVIRSFLDTYKAHEQIEVSQSVLSYRKELLELTEIKFKLGVATRLDVLRVEVQVARDEEGEILARNSYENRLDTLLNTLNYERHNGDIRLAYEPMIEARDIQEDHLIAKALNERIDLQIQELEYQKLKLDLRNAEVQLENKVMIRGSMRKHSTDRSFEKANDFENKNWNLGLSYELPLGNNERREVLLSQQARLENHERLLQEAKNDATLEVRSSIRNIRSTRKRLEVMKKNLETAKENLKLAKLSYEKGIKSSIEVLDAQDDLLAVNKDYINTLIDWKIAQHELDLRTGTLPIPDSILQSAKKWLKDS